MKLDNAKIKIISGKEFMERYVSTDSGDLEYAVFEEGVSLGECLGKGMYFSFSKGSAFHYENHEDCIDVGACRLIDDAKILVLKNTDKHKGSEIKKFAKKCKADGVFDIDEYNGKAPYLGLVIYNTNVLTWD